jgi:CheY-like chemotaxis protein
MLKLLVSHNPALLEQLSSQAFQRAGVSYNVAENGAEALSLIESEHLDIVILDVGLPGLDGLQVCRRVKGESVRGNPRIVLVYDHSLGREELRRLAASGCDDVFLTPAPFDELFEHVAPLVGIPSRVARRISVSVEVELLQGSNRIRGQLLNLSLSGAMIGLHEPIFGDGKVMLQLEGERLEARTQIPSFVVWRRPAEHGFSVIVGVQFVDVSPSAKRLIASVAPWAATTTPAGVEVITFQGSFTEETDFSELVRHLESVRRAEFEMSGVRYINSWGVRCWLDFLDRLPGELEYSFVRMSMVLSAQANMVLRMLGRGDVRSFYVPYRCDPCDRNEDRLLQREAVVLDAPIALPLMRCIHCGNELKLDDIAERFFSFLTPLTF